jgi:hypothetical protein
VRHDRPHHPGRNAIDQAQKLAALGTIAAVREHAGTDDILVALAQWWGAATVALAELAAVAERSGGGEDSRRLDRIRVVLARFDWEHDDRQLALEAIERIADGGAQ